MAPDTAPPETFTMSVGTSDVRLPGSSTFSVTFPPVPPERRRPLTFRNSKIIYYGPHACENCGVMICKMGHEFGGAAFTYPDDGPIYPNTEWHPHVCDPELVQLRTSLNMASQQPR